MFPMNRTCWVRGTNHLASDIYLLETSLTHTSGSTKFAHITFNNILLLLINLNYLHEATCQQGYLNTVKSSLRPNRTCDSNNTRPLQIRVLNLHRKSPPEIMSYTLTTFPSHLKIDNNSIRRHCRQMK